MDFPIFNALFEVESAYGTVAISVGLPRNAYSFYGAYHTGRKLMLCAVMLRDRYRGLPIATDHAILLPSESLAWTEEEDGQLKRTMTGSRAPGVDRRRLESATLVAENATRNENAACGYFARIEQVSLRVQATAPWNHQMSGGQTCRISQGQWDTQYYK